jgi:hypothetical protein
MNLLATFGNLNRLDGIAILVIVLLLLRFKRLPEIGVGTAVRDFIGAEDEIEHGIKFSERSRSRAVFFVLLSTLGGLIVGFAIYQR